jgi:asparagine N-glycosylation enzyme membrane subunit Stt3
MKQKKKEQHKGIFWAVLIVFLILYLVFSLVEKARLMSIVVIMLIVAFYMAYKWEVKHG